MKFQSIFLRCESKEAMLSALIAALPTHEDEDGQQRLARVSERHQLVLLPGLMKPAEDEDEPEPIPGYHANLITSDQSIIDALAPLTIHPRSPLVGWSGNQG